MPFFSVIIPTYNRAAMAKEAVDSVLSQTCDDYEIIVVDDGSSDETTEVMAQYDDCITYRRQQNSGVAAARNVGISISRGNYICYLDSDDLWPQSKLALYKDIITSLDHPPFVFSDFHKHNILNAEAYEASNSGVFRYIYELAERINETTYVVKNERLLQLLFRGYPFYPSTFAVRRDVHDHYRWDPGVLKSEDFNLILKISSRYPFTYIDKSLCSVRIHDSNKSADFVTKNHINIMSMKLYRDLYANKHTKGYCNKYLSHKYFSDTRAYLERGLYKGAIQSLTQALTYSDSWKKIGSKLFPLGKKNER